ncbi:hypothetical protein, variant [Sphaeroforma arctica JP610]|uniref:Alginate lyase domain-containing protein n=1 Tax=Sphaeroforma arctica JP610 TaxID=667725 RepID=A0A0L0FWY1_9EUKA|nr:hypothetical protein, variant [Sphaeroforma arctica JP610]KNC81134.1 hypothetical protein, variant [Sphaeroforma arctica JP610]|eukprot:XP_014155036.1 hypothetical protein, variant [Sphaeroforma arctica JP610]
MERAMTCAGLLVLGSVTLVNAGTFRHAASEDSDGTTHADILRMKTQSRQASSYAGFLEDTYMWDMATLEARKRVFEDTNVNSKDKDDIDNAVKEAKRLGEKFLERCPFSIMLKEDGFDGQDKSLHQYVSYSTYWWPCNFNPCGSTRAEAREYIATSYEAQQMDLALENLSAAEFAEKINKNSTLNNAYVPDKKVFYNLHHAIKNAAIAYYFSGDEELSDSAVKAFREFFINEDTKMNPKLGLSRSQAVLGYVDSRIMGIMDFRLIVEILDALAVLNMKGALTESDREGLYTWLQDYKTWLETEGYWEGAINKINNHAPMALMQMMGIAMHLGEKDQARSYYNDLAKDMIDSQMESDGALPDELSRTRPTHYVAYCLAAFAHMAHLGAESGSSMDIWVYCPNRAKHQVRVHGIS